MRQRGGRGGPKPQAGGGRGPKPQAWGGRGPKPQAWGGRGPKPHKPGAGGAPNHKPGGATKPQNWGYPLRGGPRLVTFSAPLLYTIGFSPHEAKKRPSSATWAPTP